MFNILKVVIPSQLFFLPYIAKAKTISDIVACDIDQCNICDLLNVIQEIADIFIFTFLPAAVVAAVVWAGVNYIYSVSLGDVSKVTFFSSKIKNLLIGMLIILSSWLIVSTFFSTLGYTKSWNSIECAEKKIKEEPQRTPETTPETTPKSTQAPSTQPENRQPLDCISTLGICPKDIPN